MKNSDLKILMVEDNENDRLLVERELQKSELQYLSRCVDNRDDFLRALSEFQPEVVLCDFSLPQFGAPEALSIVSKFGLDVPVIVVTGTLTDETAVECLKKGAVDYVIKEKIVRLPSAIKKALELNRSQREKREIEESLRQSKKQLQIITDVLPVLLAYISPDLKFQFCNRTYEKWFNCSLEEISGRHIKDFLGENLHQSILREIKSSLPKTEAKFESTLEYSHHEKTTPQFVSVNLVSDVDKDGRVKGYVCLITNIDDRIRAENDLKSAKEVADAASRAKSQFLANMSHEMRTPLSAISGLTELLLLANQDPSERTVWVEKISRNCEHLKKMIDEILDLSKVEAGKLEVQKHPFSITETVVVVKSILFPLAKQKNLDLQFETEGEIPESINSDPIKLRHILVNIVGNAIKFSDAGPITVRIKLVEGSKLAFEVTDRGRGMSQEQATHLFEPFMQVDSSMTRKFGGTGLGLSLAKRFAKALGGDVELTKSQPGLGSTFTITIDHGIDSQKIDRSEKITNLETVFKSVGPKAKDYQNEIVLNGTKILLVEDSIENQYLIKRFLEMAGARVDVASDGEEGVAKALASDVDVVLMDIQMPVLDGYHATSRLRFKGYQKPIVALTAHAYEGEKERCLKGGFDDFLTKPVKRIELLNNISKFKRG